MNNPIFVALDTQDTDRAFALSHALQGLVGGIKLGKEFFTAQGPQGARRVCEASGLPLFLDLKFHDIPNTVAGAVRAALPLKPFMLNVHAGGGAAMMRAAADAATLTGADRPLVIGVTVLTSLGDDELGAMGVSGTAAEQVVRLARLTQDCGLDGVVCSAREITVLRQACGPDFKLVVPGIRPAWSSTDDQRRIVTPSQALALGADYLVIGRPITAATDPAEAAQKIADEIAEAA
ncbi:MAG: orotidine-5'-phosphate decarboxylase [Rhodospirillales bacterium]|jgi:orotidine-5'-phosphate decarboxylase|nr:orotidine-5'-phosphate decarboxylase [Rhodospirillales bacterium]